MTAKPHLRSLIQQSKKCDKGRIICGEGKGVKMYAFAPEEATLAVALMDAFPAILKVLVAGAGVLASMQRTHAKTTPTLNISTVSARRLAKAMQGVDFS